MNGLLAGVATDGSSGGLLSMPAGGIGARLQRWRYPLSLLLIFAAVFGLELWLFREVWSAYHPSNDDIGLLVHSTSLGGMSLPERLQAWLGEGFSNYWYIYPDWTQPHTHYLRPGVNVAFLLLHGILGDAWNLYLVACYALYAAVLVLVVDTACRTYRLTGFPLAFSVLAVALTPAAWFEGELFFHPSFAFDAVVAGLIVLAFRAYRVRRYGWMLLWLTLAVFTKETALAAAAAATSGVLLREWRHGRWRALRLTAIVSVPALLWLLARWFAFGSEVGVGVAAAGTHSPLLHALRELLEWPFNDGQLNADTVAAIRRMDFSALPAPLLMQLFANLGFVVVVGWTLLRRWRLFRRTGVIAVPVVLDTLLWLSWLTALLMVTAVTPRIGLAASLFAVLLLAHIWQRAGTRQLRLAATAVATLLLVLSFGTSQSLLASGAIATNVERSRNQAKLHMLLRQEAVEGRTLMVVNDFSSRFVSNDDLRRFVDAPGRVLRISSIEYVDSRRGAPDSAPPDRHFQVRQMEGRYRIDAELPPGYRYHFEDADQKLLLRDLADERAGASGCRYRFPDLRIDTEQRIHFGARLSADCMIGGDVRIVYYDPADHRYKALP